MPLFLPRLTSSLLDIFNRRSDDQRYVADRIGEAYLDYAKLGQSSSGAPLVFKGTEGRMLADQIYLMISGRYPPYLAAQAISIGVTNFWMTPPVVSLTGGAVLSVLTSQGVTQLIASLAQTIEESANNMANALETMTRTVFIVEPIPFPSGVII